MKVNPTPYRSNVFILMLTFLMLAACKHDTADTQTFHINVPFYISITKARNLVSVAQMGEPISAPGKIYTYGNYLFIAEPNKGIHVVDNTNPYFPHFINFISLQGNVDIAINSNILYADNYVDLLAFDISNPKHIKPVKRIDDAFAALYYDKSRGIIMGYKDTVVTQSSDHPYPAVYFTPGINTFATASQSQTYGTGGSTARFTLMNGYLYTIDQSNLKLFDVSQPANPGYLSSISLGFNVETIFPYQNKLFIGTTTGMQIYDASIPSSPVKLSTFQHISSCDPVIVQGKYAYVTLRTGTTCARGTNELDVVNIEDATHPVLVSTSPMINPHGLAIADATLFICEGMNGLKAFNNTDLLNIGKNQLSFLTNIDAEDVIAGPKSLIVTGSKGIYQYDYSDASNLKIISRITPSPQYQ
jgi:hypothetical protein